MTPYQRRRHSGEYDPSSANYLGSIGTTEVTPEPTPEPPAPEPPAEPRPEPTPEPIDDDPDQDESTTVDDEGDDPRATKKALELAAAHGIDLAGLQGSGLHGRITVGDVDAAFGSE